MKNWTVDRCLFIKRVIVASIMVLVFIQAFYHLATGGLPSFITEVTAGIVLAFCLWLSTGAKYRHSKWRLLTERGLLITITIVILTAGIYHGTHQGYYSGVLQPLAAGVLGFAIYLSYNLPNRKSP